MPISDEIRANNKIDYKQKYSNLKRKLKILIYENECYLEELRKAERQLLQVSRDKSYLLDRLLQYETVESSTSDSEDTLSSDSDTDVRKNDTKKKKVIETTANESQPIANNSKSISNNPKSIATNSSKKKKTTNASASPRVKSASSTGKPSKPSTLPSTAAPVSTAVAPNPVPVSTLPANAVPPAIKIESSVAATCCQSSVTSSTSSVPSTPDGHMTSEELERHLESRRQPLAMLMPEKTPLTVPVELFSNESSGLPDDDNNLNFKVVQ